MKSNAAWEFPSGQMAHSEQNSTALRDICVLLSVYALWELSAWLTKRKLLRNHPKKRGVPLAQPLRPR